MRIGASGIITNERGELLVIRRDDTRTWAAPGGLLEAGEQPTEGMVREVEEETGFKTLPVRLVGLQFLPLRPHGSLIFTFRGLLRGGEARPSAESLAVAFTPTQPIGVPMLPMHRQRVQASLRHAGGPPAWSSYRLSWTERVGKALVFGLIYPFKDWQRWRRGEPRYTPPPQWQVSALTIVRNVQGETLWVRDSAQGGWRLPGGPAASLEPPWDTAQRQAEAATDLRVTLIDLAAVYTRHEQQMCFVFTAQMTDRQPHTDVMLCPAGQVLPDARPAHIAYVAAANAPRVTTLFLREG